MSLPDTLLPAVSAALLALLVALVTVLSRRAEARAMTTYTPDPYRHVCQWCGAHTCELVRCAHGASPLGVRRTGEVLTAISHCPREVCYDCALPHPSAAGEPDGALYCPEHGRRPFGALLLYWPRADDLADDAVAPGAN